MPSIDKNSDTAFGPLREWAATGVAVILGVALVLAASLTNFDFIKLNLKILDRIEKYQVDDILVGFALLFAGVTVDRWLSNQRKRRRMEMAQERLKVLHATMRTVQDIVSNLLNNIQFVWMEAEGALPEETLKQLDRAIEQAERKIRALGNLDEVKGKQMASGVGIDYASEQTNVS
jgi:hypothetical protein